jgi:GT2 family glycosyltransferase
MEGVSVMNRKNRIAAVVVTYNRKELLRECLGALLGQTQKVIDILLVDNASTDGTYEYVEDIITQNENIIYMNTGSNIGGAGGFNYGLKEAYNRGYDYMWIMDDDTIPNADALEKLLNADRELKGHYGFLASCVLWTDGSYCVMNKPLADQDNVVLDYENLNKGLMRVSKATFVSLFFKRRVIERMGLPLKEYFIWGDDQEYTLRISKKYPCYFVSDSRVVHKMKNNVGSDLSEDDKERIPRYELAFRNDCYTAWKNGPMYIVGYYELVLYTYKKILCGKAPYKIERLKTLTKGSLKGLFFHPKVEYVKKTK